MKSRALFITFEGPECAGKTTQIELLKEFYESQGVEVVVTREPGGTEIGEKIRDIVKHHISDIPIADKTELLLFAASRAQHIAELIKPALKRGAVVICDRFIDSTVAYQGGARGLDLEMINLLNKFAIGDTTPDKTFLLDLSVEDSLKRAALRVETQNIEDRIEAEDIAFHKRVRDNFLKLATENRERIVVVNAVDSKENIHQIILDSVKLI